MFETKKKNVLVCEGLKCQWLLNELLSGPVNNCGNLM